MRVEHGGSVECRPTIVLGMHRSGTSLVAHVIHAAGISAGPQNMLIPPSNSNRDGYWEHIPLVNFNDLLLSNVKASWIVPPASGSEIAELLNNAAIISQAKSIVAGMWSHSPLWLWKDPRMCLLLPFWKPLLLNPVYIIVVRSPFSIAASLQLRNSMPISASLLLWQAYVSSLAGDLETCSDTLVIEYEALVTDARGTCRSIDRFLSNYHVLPGTRAYRLSQMVKVVQPELWHMRSVLDPQTSCAMDESQRSLYDELKASIDGPLRNLSALSTQMYPGWRDYLTVWDSVTNLIPNIRRRT
jgi:hypothetical protein